MHENENLRAMHRLGVICREEHLAQPGRYSSGQRVGVSGNLPPFFCVRLPAVPPLLRYPRPFLRP